MTKLKFWCLVLSLFCYKKWAKTQNDFVAYRNDSMHCKQTGFYQKSLEICFKNINELLEEECKEELEGFNGQIECKLYISLQQERVLMSRLKAYPKAQPLTFKQRSSIKKALRKIDFTLKGKENNQRLALSSLPYQTTWVYSVEDGKFKSL